MLTIRLQRFGRRNFATFRVVVTESRRAPQSGKYVEMIGWWNPHTDKAEIDTQRASYWLSVGAQPTDVVYNLLVDAGVVQGKKRNVLPKKTPPVAQQEEAPQENAAQEAQQEGASQEGKEGQEASTGEEKEGTAQS